MTYILMMFLISEYDITYLKNNIVVVLDDDTFKCEYVAGRTPLLLI